MLEKELREIVHAKNDIILKQAKRIMMLEERFNQLRKKYFQLKYMEEREKRSDLAFNK